MVWLPDGEEKSKDMSTGFDRMYERDRRTDRHTDRRTPHSGIGCACTALRGKNYKNKSTAHTSPATFKPTLLTLLPHQII